jgi:hypothetical protein
MNNTDTILDTVGQYYRARVMADYEEVLEEIRKSVERDLREAGIPMDDQEVELGLDLRLKKKG